MSSRRTVELISAQALSDTVRGLRFACVDGAALSYVPGQWLNFDLPVDGGVVRRAYSIASAPDPERPAEFEIAVTRVDGGGASQVLHELALGERCEVDGPHGFFTREGAREQPAVFVGTGTGVCPLRAMLLDELRTEGPPLTLLFGCRTERDILFAADFEAAAARAPRFRYLVTLSRPGEGWAGLRGYVQSHLPSLIQPQTRPHVYVCGLTRMVNDVRRTLKEQLGFDRRLIHSERYD